MGRIQISGRFVGDAYMRPVRFSRQVSVAVMPRAGHAPPLPGGKFFGGAVRRERVGGASKNVS